MTTTMLLLAQLKKKQLTHPLYAFSLSPTSLRYFSLQYYKANLKILHNISWWTYTQQINNGKRISLMKLQAGEDWK